MVRCLRWMATVTTLAVCCASPTGAFSHPLAGPVAAPAAKHHKKKKTSKKKTAGCKVGQARLRIGKRTICVTHSLPATHAGPQTVLATTALQIDLGTTRDRHGRRSKSLTKLLQRISPHARGDLEKAISIGFAKSEELAATQARRARAAAAPRAVTADAGCGSSTPELPGSSSSKVGEADVTLSLENGATKLGIDLKGKGIDISVTLSSCGDKEINLDSCPTAEGKVEGHSHDELQASFKVTEGAKVVLAQAFKLGGETSIKAQTGDDGKLDYYDIKHVYTLVASFGGSKAAFGPITVDTTYIGEAHIDMRSGTGSPPPAQVDVMLSMAGVDPAERIAAEIKVAHESQAQADKEFSAVIEKATSDLRVHEAEWLSPNHCASIHFEPAPETLKLKKGQTGTFKSTAEASTGGAPPAATWTLSGQQNASFTLTGGSANPLSTSYSVTNAGKDIVVSTVVKATSKAGVAEGTWKQKTEQGLSTITGTFSGSFHDQGEVVEWSGTATFTAFEQLPEATVLKLSSSEVTAIASGFDGGGCKISGTEEVSPFNEAFWTINGEGEGLLYQIVAPFGYPGNMKVTLSDCPEPPEDGQVTTTGLGLAALESGDPLNDGLTALLKTSPDGKTFDGSATALGSEPDETYSWSWSFKGST
jgi:hypothetical protein